MWTEVSTANYKQETIQKNLLNPSTDFKRPLLYLSVFHSQHMCMFAVTEKVLLQKAPLVGNDTNSFITPYTIEQVKKNYKKV